MQTKIHERISNKQVFVRAYRFFLKDILLDCVIFIDGTCWGAGKRQPLFPTNQFDSKTISTSMLKFEMFRIEFFLVEKM